jgi:hypothetical protein
MWGKIGDYLDFDGFMALTSKGFCESLRQEDSEGISDS